MARNFKKIALKDNQSRNTHRLQIKKLFTAHCSLFILLLIFLSCSSPVQNDVPINYSSFRDVPGITRDEIKAIESFQERGIPFVYGVSPSTEAFYNVNGELKGFTPLLCEWLTTMFDIPFIPKLYDWDEVLAGLESGEIDFTGELTATEERRKSFIMTDAIATRFVSYFRIAGSEPLADIAHTRPLRYGFFSGTITYNDVLEHRDNNVIPFFADNFEEAYQLLQKGEIDAFVDEHTSEAAYEQYGDVIVETFFPILFGHVSMSTQKPANAFIISVMQKVIKNGGDRHLAQMYNLGEKEYAKNKLLKKLTIEERLYIQSNQKINIVAEHDNYPISFYNIHDKEFQGIFFDVLKEIESLTDLRFQLVNDHDDDWVVILKMLEDGEASILSELIHIPEREGRFIWPKTSVLTDYHAFLSKEEHRNIKINEIMNIKVGLVEGYAQTELFNKWFPEHSHAILYDSFTQAFKALENNEIDVVMGSKIMLLVMTNYYENPGYKANLVLDYPYPSTFGINKNEVVLCSIIDKALEIIDTESIESQWTNRTYDYRIKIEREQTRLRWMVGATVIIIFIFALSLFFRNKKFEKIQEESTSKSIFLANMSHEIRTPMNAITGMAEMLLRGDLSKELRCYAQDIKHAGNNLISIINDILDISKIEAGKLEIVPVNYKLSSLVNDTVNIIRARLGEKPIRFDIKVDESIPNNLIGDEVRVRQIILNLLSNAVKYTEKGGINFSINIDIMDADTVWLKITVADTGKGIKPEDQVKLFNNFVQVDKKKNVGIEGTGLGLAITKRLCDAMNGTISLESEYGKGSTFTVFIPQSYASLEPFGALEIIEQNNIDNTFEVKRILEDTRILVVDDLPVNLKVAEGLLLPYGAKVDTCLSGEEAIKLVKQNEYGIIFMDHMMPEMDGIEATKRIREFNKTVPIIALTANAVVGMKEMFIENGFNDFLSKPIDIIKLDEIIERWTGNKDGDREKEAKNKDQKPIDMEQPLLRSETNYDVNSFSRFPSGRENNSQNSLPDDDPQPIVENKNFGKRFMFFSCIIFFAISFIALVAYSVSARQINMTHIEQQLAIASETIRLRLITTVSSELSLVLKMADTPAIKQYFTNPSNPYYKSLANEEFAIYEQQLKDKMVFWISDVDKIFYSTGNEPYVLDPNDPESYWYNMTMYETDKYNFNINYNPDLQQIYLWVNAPVFIDKKPIGILGTGIDLTEFSEFVSSGYRDYDQKITPFIFNKFDEITTSLDYDLVANKVRIDEHLGKAGTELIKAASKLNDDESISFVYEGNIFQVSSISSLDWFLTVTHPEPGILALNDTMNMIFFNMLFLILLMFLVINIFISRSENAIAEQNVQLIEAGKKAEAASRAKSDFLGKISHEIRTPMNAITGINELILRSDIPDEIREYAKDIKRAGASLTSIINDILNFTETDVNKLDDILIRYSSSAAEASEKKELFSIPGVDTRKGIVMVGGKPEKYKQVLTVLCENAEERLLLLQTMPDKDSLPVFITQVHALKSALATVGANELSAQAAALETAGKTEDFNFINEKLFGFTEQLKELVKNIKIEIQG